MNNRVRVLPLDRSTMTGLIVISQLYMCNKIYDDNDDFPAIYIALDRSSRVEKWMEDATKGVQVGSYCHGCKEVCLDKDKNMYMPSIVYLNDYL
jgi:hypothetical protein